MVILSKRAGTSISMGISAHGAEWAAGIPCMTLQREGAAPRFECWSRSLASTQTQTNRPRQKSACAAGEAPMTCWGVAELLHSLGSSPLSCHSCVLPPPAPGSCYLGRDSSWFLGMGKHHFETGVSQACWNDTNTHRSLGNQPQLIQQPCGLFSLFCSWMLWF